MGSGTRVRRGHTGGGRRAAGNGEGRGGAHLELGGDHDSAQPTTVGIVDLVNFDPRHRRAEIGIVVEQPHRRKGFAREALEALHDYARRVIHLHQLYVIISIGNQPARQLFHSMGYRTTATLTDWLLLSDNTFSDAVVMQLQL